MYIKYIVISLTGTWCMAEETGQKPWYKPETAQNQQEGFKKNDCLNTMIKLPFRKSAEKHAVKTEQGSGGGGGGGSSGDDIMD